MCKFLGVAPRDTTPNGLILKSVGVDFYINDDSFQLDIEQLADACECVYVINDLTNSIEVMSFSDFANIIQEKLDNEGITPIVLYRIIESDYSGKEDILDYENDFAHFGYDSVQYDSYDEWVQSGFNFLRITSNIVKCYDYCVLNILNRWYMYDNKSNINRFLPHIRFFYISDYEFYVEIFAFNPDIYKSIEDSNLYRINITDSSITKERSGGSIVILDLNDISLSDEYFISCLNGLKDDFARKNIIKYIGSLKYNKLMLLCD